MKYTKAIVNEICKYIREGMNVKDSCAMAGISKQTFYTWKKKPDFLDAIKRAELACKRRNIKVIQTASKKNWTAAAWWLERKYKDEFAAKEIQKHEGSVAVGYGKLEGKKADSPDEAREMAEGDEWE